MFLYMGDVILVFRAIASKRQDKALALPRIYPIEENPQETKRGCATYFSNFKSVDILNCMVKLKSDFSVHTYQRWI